MEQDCIRPQRFLTKEQEEEAECVDEVNVLWNAFMYNPMLTAMPDLHGVYSKKYL